jgi:hypothetical protein
LPHILEGKRTERSRILNHRHLFASLKSPKNTGIILAGQFHMGRKFVDNNIKEKKQI